MRQNCGGIVVYTLLLIASGLSRRSVAANLLPDHDKGLHLIYKGFMENTPIACETLTFRAMPILAEALRARKNAIVESWQEIVKRELPDAESLSSTEIRDSIPMILDRLSDALASDHSGPTHILVDVTGIHGEERFHENYNAAALLTEYRILRQVMLHEVGLAIGGTFTVAQATALSAGMDIILHEGTSTFIKFLSERLRSAAENEIKFLAFLSHDLRNGLNSIFAALQISCLKMQKFPELSEEVQRLEMGRKTIMNTINGMERLLTSERLGKQTSDIKFEAVELDGLVSQVIRGFEGEAKVKAVTLENLIELGFIVKTDQDILSIALTNLVTNALKYSTKGSIRIKSELSQQNDRWSISVADEGHGIATEQLEKIFDAFYRGSTYGQSGIGLGLTIVTRAVKLLKGTIKVESEQGIGSLFTLTFYDSPSEKSLKNDIS